MNNKTNPYCSEAGNSGRREQGMIIFHQFHSINQNHLYIPLHDIPIGTASVVFLVVNSIRPKSLYLRKKLIVHKQFYICTCQFLLAI